jgi:hypothetical protein
VACDPFFTDKERRFVQEVFPLLFFGIKFENWHREAMQVHKEATIRSGQFSEYKLSLVPGTDMESIATDVEFTVLELRPVVRESPGEREWEWAKIAV